MSEAMENRIENPASEAAEDKNMNNLDDRENAPRDVKAPEEKKPADGKKKKRKKNGVPLAAAALLVVVALAFGAVGGYGYGRNVGAERLQEAEAQILALSEALSEIQGMPVSGASGDALSSESQSILHDLAGGAAADDGVADELMGEESLEGGNEIQTLEEPVIVAEYNGGKIYSDEAAREYSEQMTNLVFAGYEEEEIASALLNEVLRYMVSDRVLEEKAKEMGLYELTEADRAAIDALAEETYNAQLDFYRDYVNTEGMTEEEATGAVKAYMMENEGLTLDGIRAELENGWWADKVYDEITRDVTVDEAALKKAYDEKLAQQKESFTAYADDFEFAQMNGDTIVYNLPGYRAVRMLLVSFNDPEALEAVNALSEEIMDLDPLKDKDEIEEYVAEIDGYYAGVEETAFNALNEITNGADFMEVLGRVGMDAGMKDKYLLETGYYVAENSLLWPRELINAAMELEKPGDISGIVRVGDGVCILQYVGDVAEGAVPLEDVREALTEDTIEAAKYDEYDMQMNRWLLEANAAYYPERMQ